MENNNKQKTNKKPWLIKRMSDDFFMMIYTSVYHRDKVMKMTAGIFGFSIFLALDLLTFLTKILNVIDGFLVSLIVLFISSIVIFVLIMFYVVPLKKINEINNPKLTTDEE